LCLASHAEAGNGALAFGWACDEMYDNQEWHYDVATKALYIQWPDDPSQTRRCLDVETADWTEVQIWDCLQGTNQQWQFQYTMVRGYGGLCLTRPSVGWGSLTMEPCTGASPQLWRVDQSQISGFVQLRSATGNLCLTLDGGSGSDALVEPCSPTFIYLPLVQRTASPTRPTQAAIQAPADIEAPTAVRDFYLGQGGLIGVPSFTSDSLCLDVQDVWDSQFTSGQGGPVAGQRVQFFKCYDTQLNQKWSFSGHVVSGNKCLALSGSATANGAGAFVTRCSTAPEQDWDYYW
jgi:hypothetical protein